MPEPHLRAADADRAAVASLLGEHMAAGRLTVEEYDDRLARAYAAKTYGDLSELTADLPGTPPTARPVPVTRSAPGGHGRCGPVGHGAAPYAWGSWLSVSFVVVAIWAATSLATWNLHGFWPVWVIVPWGAVLLAQTLGGGRGRYPAERRRLR
jgi:hypothetical protein